jgi:parallel beta-helix repeat protein
MPTRLHRIAAAAPLLAALLAAHPARAAESYDNCAHTITSLPVTITSQGVWCVKSDLATAITTGHAITIAANNVTIDCNDFKLGGLAAGPSSTAHGIYALNRQNATIRHCSLRGFHDGIYLDGGAGHLVEDNRLDNNLRIGMWVAGGDNNVIRRNRIFDTGGATGSSQSYGIYATANVEDNIISGLFVEEGSGSIYGIAVSGGGTRVSGNAVSNIDNTPTNGGGVSVRGIAAGSSYMAISGNQVTTGVASASGIGIGSSAANVFCNDNVIAGFSANINNCLSSGNLTPP